MRSILYFLILISTVNVVYSQKHSIGITFSGGIMNRNTTSNIIGQDTSKSKYEPVFRLGLNYSLRYRRITLQNEVLLTKWIDNDVYFIDIPISVKFHPFKYKFKPFLELGLGPSLDQYRILLSLQYAIGADIYLFNRAKLSTGLRPIHQFPINANIGANYRVSLLTLFTTISVDL